MKDFIERFKKMVDYGFLGIYRRQKLSEESIETKFVPAITKACGIGVFLNLKYELYKDGKRILPETEFEMFKMLQSPLSNVIDALPEKYKNAVVENTSYYGIEALFEESQKGKVVLTEDGYLMLGDSKIHASKDEADQMGEYDGQLIYEELCRGDYVKNRHFLECAENVYIPENALAQSEEQTRFMKANPELFKMCYQKNNRLSLYRCKKCGMILRENKVGVFSCVSKKCNAQLDKKEEIEMHGPGWIMSDIVARNIYYPGQLEQKIKQILDQGIKNGSVKEYILWPGKYEGRYDTWDFKAYMNDGQVFLIDAKDVEHPHWIITDSREYLDGAKFLYVVPDDKSKIYVEQIKNHATCIGKVNCLRIKEFKKIMGVK